MATREELIKQCRYYKGERDNPYFDEHGMTARALAWIYEKSIFGMTQKDKELFGYMEEDYSVYSRYGYSIDDDIPDSLKACVLGIYLHKNELPTPEEFKRVYKKWKNRLL